ncbi:MAG: T9SS type A sorting domain-containing protein, partial [Flavobacteriales bacterium]|nr:T9SS type A sorting domain-containing protein [Flavobacteriales bacterium]
LETFDIYEWYVDGELITEEPTGEVVFDEFGFHELMVVAYDQNFCPATDIANLTVFDVPEPQLQPSGLQSLCTGQTLNLSTTEEYPITQWSTGNNSASINIGFANDYWVQVTNDQGCVGISDTLTLVVGQYPNPTITAPDTVFCENETLSLSTELEFEYLWNTGDTTQTIEAPIAGDYFVTATTELGCSTNSDTLTLTTLVAPDPMVLTSGPLSWCMASDSTVTLAANDSYAQVMWSNDAADSAVVITESGIYSYVATNEFGCSESSDEVTVIEWLDPEITVDSTTDTEGLLCEGEATLSVLTETLNYTVEWDELPDETALILSELCQGVYTVTITDENGCSASESVEILSFVGIENLADLGIYAFPNPTRDYLVVKGVTANDILEIRDIAGKLMVQQIGLVDAINVSEWAEGIYTLRVTTGLRSAEMKFIVTH